MKIRIRILLLTLTILLASTILMVGEEMRPYYHSFNSAPPSSFTFEPTTAIIQPKTRLNNWGIKAVYDSSDFYTWDSISNDWQIKSKIAYKAYDNDKNLLLAIGKVLTNGTWENSYKHVYTYDSKSNITSKTYFIWQGGSWIKFKKESYSYNDHNDLTCYLVTQFNGSKWINVTKNTFTFDNHYNKLKETYQDGADTQWVNNYQYIYEYDANNNRLNETYELGNDSVWTAIAKWNYVYDNRHNRLSEHYLNWDFGSGTFVNAAMFLYQYDSNDNMLQQISQNWENDAWLNSIKTTNTYSESGKKVIEFVERWNTDITNWENRLRTTFVYDSKQNNTSTLTQEFLDDKWTNVTNFTYTYSGKHKIESIEQIWKNNAWLNFQKLTYTYNANGDQTLELSQRWNSVNKWYNAYYIRNIFDQNFVRTDETYKSWNIVIDKEHNDKFAPFITGDSIHYYVHSITTEQAEASPSVSEHFVIYPNPSNGTFRVDMENPSALRNLEIYDSTGKLILKQQSNQVNIPGSVPGIYYIKLEQNSMQHSRRIIVQ